MICFIYIFLFTIQLKTYQQNFYHLTDYSCLGLLFTCTILYSGRECRESLDCHQCLLVINTLYHLSASFLFSHAWPWASFYFKSLQTHQCLSSLVCSGKISVRQKEKNGRLSWESRLPFNNKGRWVHILFERKRHLLTLTSTKLPQTRFVFLFDFFLWLKVEITQHPARNISVKHRNTFAFLNDIKKKRNNVKETEWVSKSLAVHP